MRKWRQIRNTLRKEDESIEKKHWIEIRREPKGEEDRRVPFSRKQKMWQDMDRG